MRIGNRHNGLLFIFAALAIMLSFCGPVFATDDGARAYWHGREGTNAVIYQFLRWDVNASGSKQFAPGQYIYPNADIEANISVVSYIRYFTLLDRPSSLMFTVAGGDIDLDLTTTGVPPQLLPPGAPSTFSESSSGFADPTIQFVTNIFGTPPLRSNVDLLNYEPTWTLDAAVMLGIPIGEYDDKKLVNIGQNRWFGRFALPLTYHFGAFAPGYRNSLEITPSVWVFDDNSDFMGRRMKNDPLWQLEGHLTHDFTRNFYGSLDALYRRGFQTEINGNKVGDELDIGNLGFSLNYQVNDNFSIRTGYSSNVFGDKDLDTSVFRIQFIFGWHEAMEGFKKLTGGGH